jgi:hypothetical protein
MSPYRNLRCGHLASGRYFEVHGNVEIEFIQTKLIYGMWTPTAIML